MNAPISIFTGPTLEVLAYGQAEGGDEKIEIRLISGSGSEFIHGAQDAERFRSRLQDVCYRVLDPKDDKGIGNARIENEFVQPAFAQLEALRVDQASSIGRRLRP